MVLFKKYDKEHNHIEINTFDDNEVSIFIRQSDGLLICALQLADLIQVIKKSPLTFAEIKKNRSVKR